MKTRVNSRINNIKGRAKNSFMVKKQGIKSETRDKALGYCTFHQVNVGVKTMELKKCNNCNRFIAFINREIQKK